MKTVLSEVQAGDIVFVERDGTLIRVKAGPKTSATRIDANGQIYRRGDGSPVTGATWLYASDLVTLAKWRRQELEREVHSRLERVKIVEQSTSHLELLNDVLERIL